LLSWLVLRRCARAEIPIHSHMFPREPFDLATRLREPSPCLRELAVDLRFGRQLRSRVVVLVAFGSTRLLEVRARRTELRRSPLRRIGLARGVQGARGGRHRVDRWLGRGAADAGHAGQNRDQSMDFSAFWCHNFAARFQGWIVYFGKAVACWQSRAKTARRRTERDESEKRQWISAIS
jgi:hypothetical protein